MEGIWSTGVVVNGGSCTEAISSMRLGGVGLSRAADDLRRLRQEVVERENLGNAKVHNAVREGSWQRGERWPLCCGGRTFIRRCDYSWVSTTRDRTQMPRLDVSGGRVGRVRHVKTIRPPAMSTASFGLTGTNQSHVEEKEL